MQKLARLAVATTALVGVQLAGADPVGGTNLLFKWEQVPSTRDMLKAFDQQGPEFMNSVPPKWNAEGKLLQEDQSLFGPESSQSRDFILEKSRLDRRHGPNPGRGFFSHYDEVDGVDALLDRVHVKRLADMDAQGLTQAEVSRAPWSDDYWPIYAGVLARRYNDPSFPNSLDWKANSDYVLAKLSENASSVEALSPAEKYDLLVGDTTHSLTQEMLSEGRTYYRSFGKVESWMGLCHGWAPASIQVARPEHVVTVLAADGVTKIPFYPSDLKALTTLLWANADVATHFGGSRCNVKNPKADDQGRLIEPQCFDENPGAWHLILVNKVGVEKASFVLDATYDYQVWNQPIASYRYTYFNPATREPVPTLTDATQELASFAADRFKKYRSPEARSVVGVALELTYVAETAPSSEATDSPERDRRMTVRYLYDLELDAAGTIVGGEWYLNLHPDFVWAPAPGAQARSVADDLPAIANRSWDGKGAIPREWREPAAWAGKNAQPVAKILETLNLASRLGLP